MKKRVITRFKGIGTRTASCQHRDHLKIRARLPLSALTMAEMPVRTGDGNIGHLRTLAARMTVPPVQPFVNRLPALRPPFGPFGDSGVITQLLGGLEGFGAERCLSATVDKLRSKLLRLGRRTDFLRQLHRILQRLV